jgi:hypothetical protein
MKKNHSRSIPVLATLALLYAGAAPAQYSNSQSQLVRCESVNSREVICRLPAGQSAEFVSQESRADCIRGRTYFIEADRIIVNNGCRATFRLFDAYAAGGDALRSEMRTRLSVDLGRMIRDDNRLGSTPSVTIISDRDRDRDRMAGSYGQVGYEGTARVERNGVYWNTVEFDATYDTRSHAFTRIEYDITGAGNAYDRIDPNVAAYIGQALSDEVRRQLGSGTVQTVVNWRYRSTRSGGTDTYTGKFAYSHNDGVWQTRAFEAQLNPADNRVRNVRIWRLE